MILQKRRELEIKTQRDIPDIAGNQGYPPRHEPSSEQVKEQNRRVADELRSSYQK
jgi:hypothetical protein